MKPAKTRISVSKKEIQHILIAWIVISIAFGIVIAPGDIFAVQTLTYILISAATVGIGFLFHELAHKVVAQRYRCWAEFRANFTMLFLALLMSFAGFVFAAPGAVVIFGNVTKRQNGLISVAGPATNLVLAVLFIPLLFTSVPLLQTFGSYGFFINSFLALFNMIPAGFFDGRKVWMWNKAVYAAVMIISVAFVVLSFL